MAGFMRPGSELTILLTLKDRVDYTARWMDYASSVSFPFKVLIADGGSDDSVEGLLSGNPRYGSIDYEYIRYPQDRSYADYYAKIADALTRVETPYVAMADNDDFFVVDSLRRSVSFLSENPDYVACGGQGAIFWMHPEGRPHLYGGKIEWKCTLEPESIEAAAARERIRGQSISSSDTSYYDVKRSVEAKRQFEIVRSLDLTDLFLVENLVGFLTAVAGKTRRLEGLYLVRQHNAPASSGGTHQQQYGDWFGRMLVESWSRDFEKFVTVVSEDLAGADGIPLGEARQFVIDSYRMLVAPALLSIILDEPTVTISMSAFVASVRRLVRLPKDSRIRKLARFLYRRARWISLDCVYGTEILTTPVPNAGQDIGPILRFLARGQ